MRPREGQEALGTSPRMRGKPFVTVDGVPRNRNIPAYAGKTGTPTHTKRLLHGTSPRMRGKQIRVVADSVDCGNIPAYAGKTDCPPKPVIERLEHPRVCGENHRTSFRYHAIGTSPRMRGKPLVGLSLQPDTRNIPAYAGKTFGGLISSTGHPEHPRVCGENPPPWGSRRLTIGTSPRMRGKLAKQANLLAQGRNIPAYAGKTFWSQVPQNRL